ncbi:MAG TPA: hypothetical protein VHJ17_19245 [Thermomonospora sp.]|nr:hypothetical protein [Thermomonospora sp.]
MTERAAPFYCPYCGDEDLEPTEGEGSWYCRACARAFRLKFLGVGVPGASGGPRDRGVQ